MDILRFITRVALIEFCVFLLILILHNKDLATTICVIMFLPSLWLSRIINGWKKGEISERFRFMSTLGIPKTLQITTTNVIKKKENDWEFKNYIVRESIMCLLLWIIMLISFIVN